MKLVLPISDFNLEHTLECGQAFRWERREGSYFGLIDGAFVKATSDGSTLLVESDSELGKSKVLGYFGLDDNLESILEEIDVDRNIHQAILKFRGLRILRQEPWECLASYILSTHNNIPRVKGMVERLSRAFGKEVSFAAAARHTFPEPENIARAGLKELKKMRLGFRARSLRDAAKAVASGELRLEELENLSYDVAKKRLLCLRGVGEKVADCVLLFSFKKFEAFPVDVWIKRYVERSYFGAKALAPKRIGEFARGHFGRYAGYAQEYLYHYARRI